MAHKHGYLELKNKNAKPFMKKVGETVTIIVKGKVTRAEMQADYENDVVIAVGEEVKKTVPSVDVDVISAAPQDAKETTDSEFEHEIFNAKITDGD